jgi:hypothetical protein
MWGLGMLTNLKKIIVVSGVGNTGKTSAIKMAMEKLSIVVNPNSPKSDVVFIGRVYDDGGLVFCGIASGGDTEEIVTENLECFHKSTMDLSSIVIASKSYGKTITAIEAFAERFDFLPDWLSTQWVESTEQRLREAERISDEIIRLLRQ